MDEFDRLAWATLNKEGNLALVRYILENDTRYTNMGQPNASLEEETPGQLAAPIAPIFEISHRLATNIRHPNEQVESVALPISTEAGSEMTDTLDIA